MKLTKLEMQNVLLQKYNNPYSIVMYNVIMGASYKDLKITCEFLEYQQQ